MATATRGQRTLCADQDAGSCIDTCEQHGESGFHGLYVCGWNSAADGSGTDYAAGASYTAEAVVTLYAKWTQNLTVINIAAIRV